VSNFCAGGTDVTSDTAPLFIIISKEGESEFIPNFLTKLFGIKMINGCSLRLNSEVHSNERKNEWTVAIFLTTFFNKENSFLSYNAYL